MNSRKMIRRLAAECGCVIATGGGAILRDENVKLLKMNGRLIFLDRPPEKLTATADRPLANSPEKIRELYKARLSRYKATADSVISVADDPDEAVGAIMRCLP